MLQVGNSFRPTPTDGIWPVMRRLTYPSLWTLKSLIAKRDFGKSQYRTVEAPRAGHCPLRTRVGRSSSAGCST